MTPALDTTLVTWMLVWLLAGLAAMAVVALCSSLIEPPADPKRGRRGVPGGRDARAAARRFADRVAKGDFLAAEEAAAQAFNGTSDRRTHRRARSVLSRGRDAWLRRRSRPRSVIGWTERAVVPLPIDRVRRELTEPASSATWFPELWRMTRGGHEEIVLAGGEPIHLTVASERWTPQRDGVTFEAGCEAYQLSGYLSLRTIVIGTTSSGTLGTDVEVIVHMESVDDPDARQALGRAQRITRAGLARIAGLASR
jgi:hypothetical protein